MSFSPLLPLARLIPCASSLSHWTRLSACGLALVWAFILCPRWSFAQEIALAGTVTGVSRVPDPAEAGYKDCLTHVRFRVDTVYSVKSDHSVKALDVSKLGETDIIVCMWGFRDGVLEPPAGLRPGNWARLALIPFDQVERQYDSLMRVDDIGDYELPVFWATGQELFASDPGGSGDGESEAGAEDSAPGRMLPHSAVTWAYGPAAPIEFAELTRFFSKGRRAGERPTRLRPTVRRIVEILRSRGGERFNSPDGAFVFYHYKYLYTPDFWIAPAGSQTPPDRAPLRIITDFHAQLRSLGVELILLFPPRAAAVFPDRATGLDYDYGRDGRVDIYFEKFTGELEHGGIRVLDIHSALMAERYETGADGTAYPVYTPDDEHWSPRGVQITADLIADQIRDMDWYRTAKSSNLLPQFLHEERDEVYKPGDFAPRLYHRIIPDDPSDSILNMYAHDAKVILMGDSFTRMYEERGADLHSHLVAQLSLPVFVIGHHGAEAHTNARRHAANRTHWENVEVVIWEIAVDFLAERRPGTWTPVNLLK